MNLHEECLLKYLLNPLELAATTELLKFNNTLIEENINKCNIKITKPQFKTARI